MMASFATPFVSPLTVGASPPALSNNKPLADHPGILRILGGCAPYTFHFLGWRCWEVDILLLLLLLLLEIWVEDSVGVLSGAENDEHFFALALALAVFLVVVALCSPHRKYFRI